MEFEGPQLDLAAFKTLVPHVQVRHTHSDKVCGVQSCLVVTEWPLGIVAKNNVFLKCIRKRHHMMCMGTHNNSVSSYLTISCPSQLEADAGVASGAVVGEDSLTIEEEQTADQLLADIQSTVDEMLHDFQANSLAPEAAPSFSPSSPSQLLLATSTTPLSPLDKVLYLHISYTSSLSPSPSPSPPPPPVVPAAPNRQQTCEGACRDEE